MSEPTKSQPTTSGAPVRDRPWIFRTYAGHSTARESNRLYRSNLAKGQTGLSVAFDLPTQTGYDPDHALSRGEVGKVGVPVAHLGDPDERLHRCVLGVLLLGLEACGQRGDGALVSHS